MIEHIPAMVASGLCSLKIEGRMKTPYYVATVTSAYRKAIDDYYADPPLYESKKAEYLNAVMKSANRDFSTGFYLGRPDESSQIFDGATHRRTYDFVGIVRDYDATSGVATVEQRNRFSVGDVVEFFCTSGIMFEQEVPQMYDTDSNTVDVARHAQQIVKFAVDRPVVPLDMLRMRVK